jgi:hypothetical protein
VVANAKCEYVSTLTRSILSKRCILIRETPFLVSILISELGCQTRETPDSWTIRITEAFFMIIIIHSDRGFF